MAPAVRASGRHGLRSPNRKANGPSSWEGDRTARVLREETTVGKKTSAAERRNAVSGNDPARRGRPPVVFTYTREEEAQARARWDAGATWKELVQLLHLTNRGQVYVVAQREGWAPRAPVLAFKKGQAPRSLPVASLVAPQPDPRPRGLPRGCPRCTFAVSPATGVWVGPELYHPACVPRRRRSALWMAA
jgi:hypothetical protein